MFLASARAPLRLALSTYPLIAGTAMATSTPRMVITTTSSMRVKPLLSARSLLPMFARSLLSAG